uniref:hypothetical protein n=1 Tax=Pseudomonas sp. EA_15y_Pfl1_P104 TaxID=3088686 RepID=UPI0030D972DE
MTTTASSTHGKNKSTTSLIKNPSFWRGLILATFIALLSLFLADTTLIKQYGLSALTIAIVIWLFYRQYHFSSYFIQHDLRSGFFEKSSLADRDRPVWLQDNVPADNGCWMERFGNCK